MASSGTINGSVTLNSSKFSFYATWSAAKNVEGNYSDVTVTTYWKAGNTGNTFDTVGERSASITINGTTTSISKRFNCNPWPQNPFPIQTATTRVYHNDNGAKSITISARANGGASSYGPSSSSGSSGDCTLSASVTLDTIPRTSKPTLSASTIEMGKNLTITTNRATSTFTHKLYYGWYDDEWRLIADNVGASYAWTIPTSFANNIPDAESGWGTIRCETYNGSTKIGTADVTFTATVPAGKPTCSIQVLDGTNIKDTYGNLVKGKSTLKVKVTASTVYGSPIASYRTTADGSTYTLAEFETSVLKKDGTVTVSATVTDKRGRTSQAATASFPVLNYSSPSVGSLSVHRCDSEGMEDDQGEYVEVSFDISVTPLNDKNSAAYTISYKKTSENNYTNGDTVTLVSGVYSVSNGSYIFAADPDSSYDVCVVAIDDFGNGPIKSTSVSTAFTMMNLGASGRSLAFGKVSETDDSAEFAMQVIGEQGFTVIQNGVTTHIRSRDANWTHYMTSKKHHFNADVHVKGDIYGGENWDKKVAYADESIANSLTTDSQVIHDTRSTNETPQWYMNNYAGGSIWEFKECAAMQFTNGPTYCAVQTVIPWKDSSGSLPRQIASVGNALYIRVASSADAWGAWQQYLTVNSTIDADTLGGNDADSCVNLCTNLWGGSLSTTNSAIWVTMDHRYTGYVIIGRPQSGASHVSIFIPRWLLNSTATAYQFADETNWVAFTVSTDGASVQITKTGSSQASGCIVRVMGVS